MDTYQGLKVINEFKFRAGKLNKLQYYIIAECPECKKEFETKKNGKCTANTCLKCSRIVTGRKNKPDLPVLKDGRHILEYKSAEIRTGHGFKIKLLCECGVEYWTTTKLYRDGLCHTCIECSKSRKGKTTHGESGSVLSVLWANMRSRCRNAKGYMDKGITVCEEWDDYLTFKAWALSNGYDKTLTIDRIDNNGNYEPNNCRWVGWAIQNANKGTAGVTGYHGVAYRKDTRKYIAIIQFKGEKLLRKQADTAWEAAQIRERFIIDNDLPHLRNF